MVLTFSKMIPLGTKAPDFNLPDTVSGKKISLIQLRSSRAVIIMFICNHCPFVQHIHKKLVELAREYQVKDVQFIAISSNDIENYPEDSPKRMREIAIASNYPFPYLFDETQEVAKSYQAECTPDFYIFNKNLACVYRGRFDNSTPGRPNIPVTGADLRSALDNVLSEKEIDPDQKPSQGCNIKWKV